MKIQKILDQVNMQWDSETNTDFNELSLTAIIHCKRETVPPLCEWLFTGKDYHFIGMVVEENEKEWSVTYNFAGEGEQGVIRVQSKAPLHNGVFQSVSPLIHAVDWHEREAEDLFGLFFEGHPRLGDFVLHDDAWQEGITPMRTGFDPDNARSNRKPKSNWRPRRVLDAPGAFVMPIGPIYSSEAESSHFLLETIGEEIIRAFPRLFFKYRGVEKSAEGRSVEDTLLLAERFAGTTAFSHAFTFSLAVEKLGKEDVPRRAKLLRVFIAEMERFRHHIGVIEGICNATGLVVAASQAGIMEEKILRMSAKLTGHRYFFGLAVPGGLSRDIETSACKNILEEIKEILLNLKKLEKLLNTTSSFLDRLEEVGIITQSQAQEFELAGPVARGSDFCNDIRHLQPYSLYESFEFEIPCEQEGDGYARLRVFFTEAKQSVRIMDQVVRMLEPGSVFLSCRAAAGTALAGVETPRGASWQWLHLDENTHVKRYHLMTPSFANWHGFHLSIENFAFQDFPIIMSTLGLSVAENDR